jgi:Thioredoxin-like
LTKFQAAHFIARVPLEQEIRAMFASRSVRVLVGLTVLQCFAALAVGSEAGALTFTGKVVLADGSPAAGAIIERQGTNQYRTFATHADADGRFQTAARFENGVHLHVRTTDGGQQAIYILSAPSVRATVRTPQEIKLRPATTLKVSVTAAGNPVADAEVIVSGNGFTASGKAHSAGQAEVRIPAEASLRSVAAFHRLSGVGGQFFREGSVPKETYKIELQPPAPHEIHVIDDNSQPVADFEFGVNAAIGDYEFILLSPLAAARVRTDEAGIAKVAWTPRDNLRIVSPQIWSNEWKVDALNSDRVKEGITIQKLRRKLPVAGRLVVPSGIDPTGILISGMGFGTSNRLDLTSARAAADGTFSLMVPAGHSYVIGILDTEWACDPWTGDLRTDRDSKQVQVELALYPATPLVVRVTRGADHQPVANTFVELETERDFKFTDDAGKRGNASGSVGCWLLTDAEGIARVGAGRGEQKVSLSAGEWTEERTLDVKSADPIEVDFYRPWIGKRKIAGQLVDAGQPFTPSRGSAIMAWTTRSPRMPLQHAPRLLDQGKFELEFDAEHASLLFLDPEQKRSGSLEIGPQDNSVTLQLQPTATYGGTLLDAAGQPIADQEIFLAPEGNFASAIVSQQPDAAGKFHWDAVPTQTALTVRIRDDLFRPRYYVSSAKREFEPGEVRENDMPRVREINNTPTPQAEVPLAEALPLVCRDATLNAMRALVVLEGDDSESTRNLVSRLLDTEETPDVLAYRVLSMSSKRQKHEAAAIAERKWPKPEAGEVLFVVLDSTDAVVAHVRLKAKQLDAAFARGRQFLSVQRPAQRDALVLLAAAREEAKASGRRMWVVSGGPRCGPCFRLARWMDDQHALLEKDYVLVKIVGGVDKNSEAVNRLLPGSKSSGIPYHAIMEPDGKVLITSTGPLGNIGMPSEVEEIRHLKRMLEQTAKRLSAVEIAALEESLAPK